LIANDTGRAFLIEMPRVRTQWLNRADKRRMFDMGPGEHMEGGIDVYVFDHDDTTAGPEADAGWCLLYTSADRRARRFDALRP
jgi:hypothetical protein